MRLPIAAAVAVASQVVQPGPRTWGYGGGWWGLWWIWAIIVFFLILAIGFGYGDWGDEDAWWRRRGRGPGAPPSGGVPPGGLPPTPVA